MDSSVNITILGPGAVGSLWACYLQKAGHNICLWTRNSTPSEQLLSLSANENSSHQFKCNDKQALNDCDLLLITVKAKRRVFDTIVMKVSQIKPHWIKLSTDKKESF